MKLLRTLSAGKRAPSRRQLLKVLGVSAAASPMIPALDGWAADPIRRLLLVFSPHGVIPADYWPTGTESNFTFPAGGILEPLAPHKQDLIILKGVTRKVAGKAGLHEVAGANLWTGNTTIGEDAGAASIDQIVAKGLPKTTDFASLQFGVQCPYKADGEVTRPAGSPNDSGCYAGPRQRIYAEIDPYAVFDRLFAAGIKPATGDTAAFDRIRAEKKSILDYVTEEITELQGRLGKEDGIKINAHLDATRDIERRLQMPAKTCGGVTRPDGMLDLGKGDNLPTLIPIMNKLLVASFACDRARVASMMYTRAFSFHKYPWLGITEGHHALSHKAGDRKIGAVTRWYMGHVKDLIEAFKAVPEGSGTLFDSMLLVWGSEVFTGWDHNSSPSPVFFAGKAGGAIPRTGRFLDFGGQNDHNQLLLTIAHAMGQTSLTKVGDLGSEGRLPNILA
jgi:hypothetical protein